jgi:antitoxin component of RelBE/YafQ-DinJ toxin-antitoxin module
MRIYYAYITPMKKAKTNLTIDPKVKRNGERLAKKSGLSLSAYITTLLVKELAKENKR